MTSTETFYSAVKKMLREGARRQTIDDNVFSNREGKKKYKHIEGVWEEIFGTFPGLPRNMNKKLEIYRGLGVDNPERVANDIARGKRPAGRYWTYNEKSACAYVGADGEESSAMQTNVKITAEVPLHDIDIVDTLYHNLNYPDEREVRLHTTKNLTVTGVKWKSWDEEIDDPETGTFYWKTGKWHVVL